MKDDFISNPNQRQIKVNKEATDNEKKENRYARINLIALKNAMHNLTPKAFELWIYFSKNQDTHTFYLSKVDFLNWSNVKSSSYYTAFEELVKEKYLIQDNNSTHYNFYEIPKISITINKVIVEDTQEQENLQEKLWIF